MKSGLDIPLTLRLKDVLHVKPNLLSLSLSNASENELRVTARPLCSFICVRHNQIRVHLAVCLYFELNCCILHVTGTYFVSSCPVCTAANSVPVFTTGFCQSLLDPINQVLRNRYVSAYA